MSGVTDEAVERLAALLYEWAMHDRERTKAMFAGDAIVDVILTKQWEKCDEEHRVAWRSLARRWLAFALADTAQMPEAAA